MQFVKRVYPKQAKRASLSTKSRMMIQERSAPQQQPKQTTCSPTEELKSKLYPTTSARDMEIKGNIHKGGLESHAFTDRPRAPDKTKQNSNDPRPKSLVAVFTF